MTDQYDEMRAAVVAALPRDLEYRAEFVPFRLSRNSAQKTKSLNWRITFARPGVATFATDYMQGLGHVPGYSFRNDDKERLNHAAEHGNCWKPNGATWATKKLPAPSIVDVLYSLLMDATAEGMSFSEWASDYGYDDDSISDREVYEQCCATSRALSKLIGRACMEKCRELLQDY